MKTVQIHEIEFDNAIKANETENYPHSGLFFSRVKNHSSDLRFVDKNIKVTNFIVPEEIFRNVTVNQKEKQPDITEIEDKKEYSQDFILEFARILLNRKHV